MSVSLALRSGQHAVAPLSRYRYRYRYEDTQTKPTHAVVESLARLFQVHHLNLQISCEIIYIFSFYCLGFAFASALPRFAWPLGLVSAEVVVYFFYKIKLAPS